MPGVLRSLLAFRARLVLRPAGGAGAAACSPGRFVVHAISERTIEHIGIALAGNPRLVPELYPHICSSWRRRGAMRARFATSGLGGPGVGRI